MENINLVRLELENAIINERIESDLFVVVEDTPEYIKFKNGSGFDFIHNKKFQIDIKYIGVNFVRLQNLFIGEHGVLMNEQHMIMSLMTKYHKELGLTRKEVYEFILKYKEVDLFKEYGIRFNDKLSDCIYFMDFIDFLISKCYSEKVGLNEFKNLINGFKHNRYIELKEALNGEKVEVAFSKYSEVVRIDICNEYVDLFKAATGLEIDRGVYKDIKYSVRMDLIHNVEDLIFLALNNC